MPLSNWGLWRLLLSSIIIICCLPIVQHTFINNGCFWFFATIPSIGNLQEPWTQQTISGKNVNAELFVVYSQVTNVFSHCWLHHHMANCRTWQEKANYVSWTLICQHFHWYGRKNIDVFIFAYNTLQFPIFC